MVEAIIITGNNGWGAGYDAALDKSVVKTMIDGQAKYQYEEICKTTDLYVADGALKVGDLVKFMIRNDAGKKTGFEGEIVAKLDNKMNIKILNEIDYQIIKNKIKGGN